MKIGIISDSHDHHANILNAIKIFSAEKVKYIIHSGDIVSSHTVGAFASVETAKLIAIFGNCDIDRKHLKKAVEKNGGQINADPYKCTVAGKKLFLTHKPTLAKKAAVSGKYDLVIYGHTHIQDVRFEGDTLIINPGEASDWKTGRGSLVILETDDMTWKNKEL